jgi:3-methyladenine DNA glycosylase Mpg
MPTRQHQKPPPGFCFAQDSKDNDGNVVPGIATRLGITYSTYRKWRMAGKGPDVVRIGKCNAARIEAVEAYLNHLAPAPAASHESRPAEPRRRAA